MKIQFKALTILLALNFLSIGAKALDANTVYQCEVRNNSGQLLATGEVPVGGAEMSKGGLVIHLETETVFLNMNRHLELVGQTVSGEHLLLYPIRLNAGLFITFDLKLADQHHGILCRE